MMFSWNKAVQSSISEVRSAYVSSLDTAYDAFLYADVCSDNNGTPLSVLSAMARMNIDPWIEAAQLSKASPAPATRRLAAMIAAVPGGPHTPDAAATIAARLMTLLPRQTRLVLPSYPKPKPLPGVAALVQSRTVQWTLLGLIALALAMVVFGVHRPQSPTPHSAQISAAPMSGSAATGVPERHWVSTGSVLRRLSGAGNLPGAAIARRAVGQWPA